MWGDYHAVELRSDSELATVNYYTFF